MRQTFTTHFSQYTLHGEKFSVGLMKIPTNNFQTRILVASTGKLLVSNRIVVILKIRPITLKTLSVDSNRILVQKLLSGTCFPQSVTLAVTYKRVICYYLRIVVSVQVNKMLMMDVKRGNLNWRLMREWRKRTCNERKWVNATYIWQMNTKS